MLAHIFWGWLFVVHNKGELYGIAKAMNVTYTCMFVCIWTYKYFSMEFIIMDLRRIKDEKAGRFYKNEVEKYSFDRFKLQTN